MLDKLVNVFLILYIPQFGKYSFKTVSYKVYSLCNIFEGYEPSCAHVGNGSGQWWMTVDNGG